MLDYIADHRVPDAVPSRPARRPDAEPLRPLRQLRRAHPLRRVSEAAVEEAGERLSRPGVPVAPRRMWPSALATLGIHLKGKIAEGAEEGRAVARLTDLGYGEQLRALFRPGTPDGPVPDGLARAVVALLEDWRPEVDAIVVVESASRPTLTADLADGLSRSSRSRRRALGDRRPGRRARAGQANSAQRIAAVGRRGVAPGRRRRRERGSCSSTTGSTPAGR